jgi:putative flavoprotein involved in K+ transport
MKERHDTVVIGGGQAGLAMSHHLREHSREHILLERRRVAQRWRSERWDSLCFQFPNWSLQLPGYAYKGDEPDGFAHHEEVSQFIEDYAGFIDAPVRCGTDVVSLERDSTSGRFVVATRDAIIEASRVVIATGPFQQPSLPVPSPSLPREVLQLHASQYFNPGQLPTGAVLVVGAGSSGCQIAEELYRCGRTVYFSVAHHRRAPRRYRGRDLLWWLLTMGRFDTTIDSLAERRIPPPLLLTGVNGGHDVDLRQFAADGVVLLGKFRGIADGKLGFGGDLDKDLVNADETAAEFRRSVDEHVRATGMETSEAASIEQTPYTPKAGFKPVPLLDLEAANIRSVIWCTGYKLALDWVHLPVFDDSGALSQQRGVTNCRGAYFLGLHWMHKFKSATLFGVGEDAAYIAEHMATIAQDET